MPRARKSAAQFVSSSSPSLQFSPRQTGQLQKEREGAATAICIAALSEQQHLMLHAPFVRTRRLPNRRAMSRSQLTFFPRSFILVACRDAFVRVPSQPQSLPTDSLKGSRAPIYETQAASFRLLVVGPKGKIFRRDIRILSFSSVECGLPAAFFRVWKFVRVP